MGHMGQLAAGQNSMAPSARTGTSEGSSSALPSGGFLLFLLADRRDDVDHASNAAGRKRATGLHQGLVIGKPSMCFREFFILLMFYSHRPPFEMISGFGFVLYGTQLKVEYL
jgi:hypothetical protein